MKGNSVYILRIVAKLSTVNMESSLTFKFGSKECLKLKVKNTILYLWKNKFRLNLDPSSTSFTFRMKAY